MTTEKMTIHKALSELKIIDSRIQNAILVGTYCIANKHSNERIKGISIPEYRSQVQGFYDQATGLMARRNAIKRAVVLSNAVTKVSVGAAEYTVAEAIEMKNHGMDFKRMLLTTLQNQYNAAQSTILGKNGDDLEKRAENYVIGIYGNKENGVKTDDFEKAKRDFITANTYELVDPIDILKKIQALEKEISDFTVEVDAALSTSNALTEIEVSY